MSDNPSVTSPKSAIRSPERLLKQAPVEPIHDDGVRVFSIGTLVFVLGLVVLYAGRSTWAVPDWWFAVGMCGVGIGVVAAGYCAWRRNKRTKDAARGIAAPTA